jgi:predicted acetyltransferase
MEKTFETDAGRFLIRPYENGDEPRVLSLWQAAFHKELAPDIWRWKYLENPFTRKLLVCAGEDEAIFALFGGIPYRANWEERSVEIVHAMDIMSHPDYRGAGLFVKTCKAYMDVFCRSGGVSFLYGFPGAYHYHLGEKYLGYRELKQGLCFLTARTGALARNRRPFRGRLRRIREVDASFDRLWETSLQAFPLSVVRDAPFLRWRFLNHPRNAYEIWGYQQWARREISAYAVLSVSGGSARLVDVVAPSSTGLIRDFIGRIGTEMARRGVGTLETWLPSNHFLAIAALSAGFTSAQEPLGVILTVRLFDHSPSQAWIAKNIFFTMADGDLI